MLAPLHVLMIETDPTVIEQVMQILESSSLFVQCQAVTREQDYTALLSNDLDMVFASSSTELPCQRALHLLQSRQLDVPFVVQTSPEHEAAALECVQQGAADYIFHGQLLQLAPLLTRLVSERHTRRIQHQHTSTLFSHQVKRLRALNALSRELIEVGMEREGILSTAAQQIAATIGDACVIWLDMNQQRLALAALSHNDSDQAAELHNILPKHLALPGQGLVRRVIEQGQPILLPLVNAQCLAGLMSPEMHTWIEHLNIHSLLLVPLVIRGQISGMVCAFRTTTLHPYAPDNQGLLQEIVAQCSLSITNTHMYESSQQLAG